MFVTRVEAKKVCMINEKVFVDDQIAVPVNGKTYYGCCAMCKTALAEDASKRTATDPVSGKTVDKADAVIGADSIGRVYYFESEANLRAFRPPPG
jgi:YHS domain-containing protein